MFKNLQALKEEDKKFGDYVPLTKGLYRLTVREAIEGTTPERVWDKVGFIETGNEIPQLTLKFAVMTIDGENEIENMKGETLINPTYTVWINETNLGWNKKTQRAKQGRAVLAALLNSPPDGDISFNSADDLIGLQMDVYMGVERNKKNEEKNVLVDINPVKQG